MQRVVVALILICVLDLPCRGQEPDELRDLRITLEAEKLHLHILYEAELRKLEHKLTKPGQIKEAHAVFVERQKIAELIANTAPEVRERYLRNNKRQDKTVETEPSPRAEGNRVFTDKHFGRAAFEGINNVYRIDVEATGSRAILKAWFAADSTGDPTEGTITLTPSSGEPVVVGEWDKAEPVQRDETGHPVRHPKLKPLEIDVSEHVTKAGVYTVRFDYTNKPGHAINIFQVDIEVVN